MIPHDAAQVNSQLATVLSDGEKENALDEDPHVLDEDWERRSDGHETNMTLKAHL